jgi:type II secretory pathway predicted ATPase ExeA
MTFNWTVRENQLNAYFGFLTEPFSKEIDARALYISAQLKAIFGRLAQLIHRRGIALLTGEVGSGKSTAIRAFAQSLESNQYDWVYIEDPTIGLRGIWNSIASQLKLNTQYFKWQIIPTIKNAIEKNFHDYHKTTIIAIDDAQVLTPNDLEEIRLFTNFKIDSHSPMTLILIAQSDFRKLIQLKSLEAFKQRLCLTSHLTGINQDEARPYVQHQLEIAGHTQALFTDDVIEEIYQQARALPRLINNLCYDCLMLCYEQDKKLVDLPILEKVLCAHESF